MNRLRWLFVVCCVSSVSAWEENNALTNAILALDENRVTTCLDQRNEQLMDEEEYWHYIVVLNQRASMGSFETIHTFKYIIGPAIGLGLAWYGTIHYFIASNLRLFGNHQSPIKQFFDVWCKHTMQGSFAGVGLVGLSTLAAYGVTSHVQEINRKKHLIQELLFEYRALEREPVSIAKRAL